MEAIVYTFLILLILGFAWIAYEVWILADTCARLQRSAPPREPIGGPTLEERVRHLEVVADSRDALSREEKISHHRMHLLGARAQLKAIESGHSAERAQAQSTIAMASEALRFLGQEV